MTSSRSVSARKTGRIAPIVLLGSWVVGLSLAEAQTTRVSSAYPKFNASEPIASARSENTATAASRPVASARSNSTTSATTPVAPKASARYDGTASPGLEVSLDGSASSGGRMWYRWLQTQGPKVTIEDATHVQARFIVPADASILGFVLVVGNASGVDAKALTIDVDDPERDSDNASLKADPGDDQTTKVGRRVTLNGVRSEPRGKLRFRWIQAGGSKIALRANDGPTASFIPTLPGTYQFALVVATTGGALSEPAVVTVTVTGSARGSAEGSNMAIDELARVSLGSIQGGSKYADELSRAYDTVADRIDTYKSFTDANTEMYRRLDSVVPRDKELRAIWIEQLFSPLVNRLASGMRTEGIDLSQPEDQGKPLTKDQKSRLAEQLRYIAAGIRASKTLR